LQRAFLSVAARLLATLNAAFRTRMLTDVPEPCDLRQLIAEITVSLQSNERRGHDRPSSCSGSPRLS
jgi:hypothetical protein